MASLHIVIGFDGHGSNAKPELVYLGRSGSESQKALLESHHERHEVFRNVVGIRKHNPHAHANKLKRQAASAPEIPSQEASNKNAAESGAAVSPAAPEQKSGLFSSLKNAVGLG